MKKISSVEIAQIKIPLIDLAIIKVSAPLAFIALVKQGFGQSRKYPEQANIVALLYICFLMNKFDIFINKNANIRPAQYTTSREKEIVG